MASSEVLYEFSTVKKWNTTIIKNPLRNLALNFPQFLLSRIENLPQWKVAISESSRLAAVLTSGGDLEITSIENNELIGRARVLLDENPEWSRLEWTNSGSLVILARSVPVLDVLESSGNYCYSIPLDGSLDAEFDPVKSVSAIRSVSCQAKEGKWCDKLFVLQYCGILRCFLIGRLSGFHQVSVFHFHPVFDVYGGLATSLLVTESLLLLGGLYKRNKHDEQSLDLTAGSIGLSLWRMVDSEPYYIEVPRSEKDLIAKRSRSVISPLLEWLPCFSLEKACVVALSCDYRQETAACATSSGVVILFELPSLRILRSFCPVVNDSPTSDLGWWSDEELAILKSDGRLMFCPVNDEFESGMEASREEKEFHPSSRLVSPAQGLCYVFEEVKISEEENKVEESKAWVITRMAGVAVYGWVKVALGWSVGRPLNEVEVTAPESVTERSVEYRLQEFRKTTPEEMFRKKLHNEEYGEALQLAQLYGLDSDVVYQQQWKKQPITKYTVRDYLAKVKNKEWVMRECLNKVANKEDGCFEILKFALKLVEIEGFQPEGLSDEQRRICERRIQFLHYQEVLEDYEDMLKHGKSNENKFEGSFYARIRSFSLLDIAVFLAQTCRFVWLDIFLSRHKEILFEHYLPILNSIPEVADVAEYKMLLPHLINGKAKVWRIRHQSGDIDPVLKRQFGMDAAFQRWTTRSDLYVLEPELAQFRLTENPPPTEVLVLWFERRSWEIERRTGVPELVQNFLNTAVELGFGDLRRLRTDVSAYCKLVYECGDASRSFVQFQQANVVEVVKNLMEELVWRTGFDQHHRNDVISGNTPATAETAVKSMEERVIPYILHSERYGRCVAKNVFEKFLVEESQKSLKLVSLLLESWKVRGKMELLESMKMDQKNLVHLAEECLGMCEKTGEQLLVPAAKLLSCLEDQDVLEERGLEDAAETLNSIQSCLRALETLSFNGVNIRMGELKEVVSDEKRSEALITRLVRGACRQSDGSVGLKTVVDWERLFQDLMFLQETALGCVSRPSCQELFVSGLLGSGDPQTMKYTIFFAETAIKTKKSKSTASQFESTMEKSPYDKTVAIILAIAREYIQGAENSSDRSAELAKLCLSLLMEPRPPEVTAELDLLAALPLLEEIGVTELPVKVIIEENKTVFIEKALNLNKKQYREAKTLLKIGNLLRIDSNEWVRKGTVLTLCAREAIAQQDFSTAAKYCKELSKMKYSEGWRVCTDLVLSGKLKNRDTNLELMNFACLYCDAELLEVLLEECRKAKILALKELFGEFTEEHWKNEGRIREILGEVRRSLRKNELRVDPFLQTPEEYRKRKDESEDFENVLLRTASVLRILTLDTGGEVEEDSLKVQALSLMASIALGQSIGWGLGCMLELGDEWKMAELAAGPFQKDEFVLEVILLFYAMKIVGENLGQWNLVKRIEPRELIKLVWRNLEKVPRSGSVERFERWTKILHQYQQAGVLGKVSKEIDVGRFVNEEAYRRDTILGTAMTESEEMYQNALRLAAEHDIPIWDVQMANLEFLLTDPNVDSATAQAIVKQHKLVSALSKDKEKLCSEMQKTVFPILDGKDHNRLLYYYLILERGCEGLSESREAQAHRSILRHVIKLLPAVDYRDLILAESNLVEILWSELKSGNVQSVSKLLPKIPNKGVKSDTVVAIWAARLFLERVTETGANGAWRACEGWIEHLDSEGFLFFVEIILFRFQTLKQMPMEWKSAIHCCVVYAESKPERLKDSMEKLSEWERRISEEVGSVQDPSSSQHKELTKEEEEEMGILKNLKDGNLAEAGRSAARIFSLHGSLASRANALEVAKNIKSKHE